MTAVLRNGLQRRPLAGRCNACAANVHVSLGGVAPLIGEPGPSGTLAADCALTSHFAAGDLWVVRAHSAEQVHPQLAELGRRTEASVSAAERSAPGRSRHIRCLPRHAQAELGAIQAASTRSSGSGAPTFLDVVARSRCGLSPPRTTVRLEVGTNSMRCVLVVSAASRLRRTGRTTPIAMVPWERDELAVATYWELGTAARASTSHKAFGTA